MADPNGPDVSYSGPVVPSPHANGIQETAPESLSRKTTQPQASACA